LPPTGQWPHYLEPWNTRAGLGSWCCAHRLPLQQYSFGT
jgi:hypothetical protein